MANSAANRAVSNAKSVASDAHGAFEHLKEDLRETASKATAAVRSGLHAGGAQVKRAVDMTSDRLDDVHRNVARRVRERPLAYTGGAVAAGIVIGLILAARRR